MDVEVEHPMISNQQVAKLCSIVFPSSEVYHVVSIAGVTDLLTRLGYSKASVEALRVNVLLDNWCLFGIDKGYFTDFLFAIFRFGEHFIVGHCHIDNPWWSLFSSSGYWFARNMQDALYAAISQPAALAEFYSVCLTSVGKMLNLPSLDAYAFIFEAHLVMADPISVCARKYDAIHACMAMRMLSFLQVNQDRGSMKEITKHIPMTS